MHRADVVDGLGNLPAWPRSQGPNPTMVRPNAAPVAAEEPDDGHAMLDRKEA